MLITITLFFLIGCTGNDSMPNGTCSGETCTYTIASDESATTIDSKLIGSYQMIYSFADTDSPLVLNTKCTIEIDTNELIVRIEGKECITLKNALKEKGGAQPLFRDHCRDQVSYHISTKEDGTLNEINLFGTGGMKGEWYGQYTLQ